MKASTILAIVIIAAYVGHAAREIVVERMARATYAVEQR